MCLRVLPLLRAPSAVKRVDLVTLICDLLAVQFVGLLQTVTRAYSIVVTEFTLFNHQVWRRNTKTLRHVLRLIFLMSCEL